jgi:hypothetical protein
LFQIKAVAKKSLFGKTLVFHSNAVCFDTYWVIIRLYVYVCIWKGECIQ